MSSPPESWPLQASVWRRQLWLRLMVQLKYKYTRRITFTPAPGSLRVGAGPDTRSPIATGGLVPAARGAPRQA
jgi:hypothetical protein